MTTLPCTCRLAWSSTAGRICSIGKLAAMGTRSWAAATRRATSSRAAGAAVGPVAGCCVGAVRGRDPVDLGRDGADAPVREAEFPGGVHCLRPVQVDRVGDTA